MQNPHSNKPPQQEYVTYGNQPIVNKDSPIAPSVPEEVLPTRVPEFPTAPTTSPQSGCFAHGEPVYIPCKELPNPDIVKINKYLDRFFKTKNGLTEYKKVDADKLYLIILVPSVIIGVIMLLFCVLPLVIPLIFAGASDGSIGILVIFIIFYVCIVIAFVCLYLMCASRTFKTIIRFGVDEVEYERKHVGVDCCINKSPLPVIEKNIEGKFEYSKVDKFVLQSEYVYEGNYGETGRLKYVEKWNVMCMLTNGECLKVGGLFDQRIKAEETCLRLQRILKSDQSISRIL